MQPKAEVKPTKRNAGGPPDTSSADPPIRPAREAASANFAANATAIREAKHTTPHATPHAATTDRDVLPPLPAEGWVWARDGSLTRRTSAGPAGGGWMGGCSIPAAAALATVRDLTVRSSVAALVCPRHARQIVAVLDRLRVGQALIVIEPDSPALVAALGCVDVSTALRSGRLFFAGGEAWEATLAELFARFPGLPIPGEFVRLSDADERAFSTIRVRTEKVLSDVVAERQRRAEACRQADVFRDLGPLAPHAAASHVADATRPSPVCVVASRAFALWETDGRTLADGFDDADLHDEVASRVIDPTDPRTSATSAIVATCRGCRAVVTANVGRSDVPGGECVGVPWVTWVTRPRVPSWSPGHATDGIVVTHASLVPLARAAGWPAERTRIGRRPPSPLATAPLAAGRDAALLADVPATLDPPERVRERSSWRLLWEAIRTELLAAPESVGRTDGLARPGGDVVLDYLRDRASRLGIDLSELPVEWSLRSLVLASVTVATARGLRSIGVPLRVHGAGWEGYGIGKTYQGGVRDDRTLASAVTSSACLINVWPAGEAWHPVHDTARPLVPGFGRRVRDVARDVRTLLASPPKGMPPSKTPVFGPKMLDDLLRPPEGLVVKTAA